MFKNKVEKKTCPTRSLSLVSFQKLWKDTIFFFKQRECLSVYLFFDFTTSKTQRKAISCFTWHVIWRKFFYLLTSNKSFDNTEVICLHLLLNKICYIYSLYTLNMFPHLKKYKPFKVGYCASSTAYDTWLRRTAVSLLCACLHSPVFVCVKTIMKYTF